MSSVGIGSTTLSSAVGSTAGGLGVGIDVTTTVNQLMAMARRPETAMQTQMQTNSQMISDLSGINSQLSALSTAVTSLSDPTGALAGQNATSSNPSVITATADSTAAAGVHSIVVSQLATTSTVYAVGVAASATLDAGTMTFTIGGVQKQLTIDGTNNTVSTLASYINANSSSLGVTAGVLQNADGTQTLALASNTSGTAGAVNVTGGPSQLSFKTGVQAKDAQFTIDGVPVTQGSNTVTDVVPGMTFSLTGTSATGVSVGVSPDTAGVTTAIQTFVNSYNSLIKSINAQFTVDPSSHTEGSLGSDGALRTLQSQLLSQISYSSGDASIHSLASIGVNMANDGTLSIDQTKLKTALQGNFAAVKSFLQDSTSGFATQLHTAMQGLTSPSNGLLNVDIKGLQDTNTSLQKSIDDFEIRMQAQQQQLLNEYNEINAELQMFPAQQSSIAAQLASLSSK